MHSRLSTCVRSRVAACADFVLKTIGKGKDVQNAQMELTKKITQRIEQTMAARASSDGGGLHMVKRDDEQGVHFGKQLKPSASILAKKLGKKAIAKR